MALLRRLHGSYWRAMRHVGALPGKWFGELALFVYMLHVSTERHRYRAVDVQALAAAAPPPPPAWISPSVATRPHPTTVAPRDPHLIPSTTTVSTCMLMACRHCCACTCPSSRAT